ncbi:MAG: hypothetical protein CR994_08530 [Maribacter sp.]|nr:MAG: hypothetical protein CR994_08530 [Maribacter sp.]
MRKTYISILICLLANFSFAQTTAIPDTNFENFLITQGIDTNGANGNILNTDAETVTSLNINVDNIVDFTGLEAFVNLEELSISNNHTIQTLSVSANTKLRILDISSYILNPGFVWSPLTTLDLSNNTLLEEITIRDFRNMTTLTLPETNTLKKVYIYYLEVSDINLSKLNGLEDIYISNSAAPLTNITLPEETQVLKKIFIGHISIPDINLSPYTVLEDIELRITYVENLQLPTTNTLKKLIITWHKIVTPLSLAGVPELIDLEISSNQTNVPLQLDITNNVKLVNVNLYSNKMTSINVTNNALIEDLNISYNQLPSVNLTNNTLLETLNASNNVIPNLDITQNTVLETVNLSNNLLPNLDVTNNIILGSLNISNNKFTGTGLDLTQNVELYYLNVSHNQIESLNISNCVKLSSFNGSYNLFSGTAILDQLYVIRLNHSGIINFYLMIMLFILAILKTNIVILLPTCLLQTPSEAQNYLL